MYIFVDKYGVLKEIISERTFRSGDSVRDKIYVYFDNDAIITAAWRKFVKADSTQTTEVKFFDAALGDELVGKALPEEPVRNLEYFNYDHTYTDSSGANHIGYQFYEIEVPDEVLASATVDNNVCVLMLRFAMSDGTEIELDQAGVIPFAVEATAGIIPDGSISETQYNYIVKLYSDNEIVPNPSGTLDDTLTSIRIKGVNYGISGGSSSGEPDQYLKTITESAGSNFKQYQITGKNYTSAVDVTIKTRPVEYVKKASISGKELSITNVVNDVETKVAYGAGTSEFALQSSLDTEVSDRKAADNKKVDISYKDTANNAVNSILNSQGQQGIAITSEIPASGSYHALKVGIGLQDQPHSASELLGEIYAVDTDDSNKGTRIIVKQNKVYYTKGKNDISVVDDDEIATKGDLGSGITDYTKSSTVSGNTLTIKNVVGGVEQTAITFNGEPDAYIQSITKGTDKITWKNKAGTETDLDLSVYAKADALTTEVTNRTNADTTLTNAISSEASTRETADNTLSASIGNKQDITDNTLTTTAKTIVGAINEEKGIIDALSGKVAVEVVTALPTTLAKNTLYYVGPDASNKYHRYLTDSSDPIKTYDLGNADLDLTKYYTKTETDSNFVKQLGAEAVSGEQYHFTYYYDIVPSATTYTINIDTITLDNNKTTQRYSYTLPVAGTEIGGVKVAGLMSADDKSNLDTHITDTTSNPHNITKNTIKLDQVDNTSDADKPVSTAQQTALDGKLDKLGVEAVSKTPYKLTYYFSTVYGEDSVVVTAHTIELDDAGNHALGTYDMTISSASQTQAGLMSKNDKVKLDGIDTSLYQLFSNKVTAWETTLSDDKYPSEKLVKDTIDTKEDKLPTYEANKFLAAYEDTTAGEVKLKWESIGLSTSAKGDIIESSELSTMAKVITRYGGDYWVLINYDDNYYEWWRTDSIPTNPTCIGQRFYSTTYINKDLIWENGWEGNDFELLGSDDGTYQWVVSDFTGITQREVPAYAGLVVANDVLDTVAKIEAAYGGTWEVWDNGYRSGDNLAQTSASTLDTTNFNYDSGTNTYSNLVATTTAGTAEIELAYCDSAKAEIEVITTITDTNVKYEIPVTSLRSDATYIRIKQRELILGYFEIPTINYDNLVFEYDITDNDSTVVGGFKIQGFSIYGESNIGVYQYHCLTHDPLTELIASKVGDTIVNTNCTTQADVIAIYGGTGWVLLASYSDGTTTVYQWHRNA